MPIPNPLRVQPESPASRHDSSLRVRRLSRLAALLILVVTVTTAMGLWHFFGPRSVDVTRPNMADVMETVSATGRVAGRVESLVGARTSGVVAVLYVHEGDMVRRGQLLARISNDTAMAQRRQAIQTRRTASAIAAEVVTKPVRGEVQAAQARLHQAQAAAAASAFDTAEAETAVLQAEAVRVQACAAVRGAAAAVREADAQARLARTTAERKRVLYTEGALARQELDEAEAAVIAAEAKLATAREDHAAKIAAASAANLAVSSGKIAVAGARARARVAAAAADAAAGDVRALQERPRPETVRAALERVRDADEAALVASVQVTQSEVRAPYDGTVTAVLTEAGAPVAPGSGLVRLAMTARPEIKVIVDEDRLPDLHPGLRAIVTSSAYRNVRMEGRVSQVGASVDATRGTVEITVIPVVRTRNASPAWIRPGQTVNVNLIVRQGGRLVVPITSVKREGTQTVAFVVEKGKAVARSVTVGDVEGVRVPVAGLKPGDVVIADALAVSPGTWVRVREERQTWGKVVKP